jgi:4-hydroxybenzoyl-CoA thioesterase/acyl-CoA thioester hydrolase
MLQPYRTTRRVEFRHTDAAGIIHFSAYFEFMEEVEHEFLRQTGLSVLMRDEEGPLSWPRVSASCEFRSPVRFEDVVEIEVRLSRLGEKSVTYEFTFTHEDRLLAEARMSAVCCRLSPDAAPRAVPIPGWIRERLGGPADNRS